MNVGAEQVHHVSWIFLEMQSGQNLSVRLESPSVAAECFQWTSIQTSNNQSFATVLPSGLVF